MTPNIISYEQCPSCAAIGKDTAEDNLVTFDTGVKYCVAEKISFAPDHKQKQESSVLLNGTYSDLRKRNISKKTCEFYGYMINAEKRVHIANYYDSANNVVCQKMRTPDKSFYSEGDKSYLKTLWGIDKFSPNENVFITITEGEIDCLSIAEVFDCKYPVVSLPVGAGNADQVIAKELHKLNKFKYVVLAFDNDEPGRQAVEKCIPLFDSGKVRVAKWPKKDANDMLIENDYKGIRDVIYNAVEYVPAPILTSDKLKNSLRTYKTETREWPWKIANKTIHPIKIPSIVTIAAKPKVGKTEIVTSIAKHFIQNNEVVGVVSLEQTIQQITLKYISCLTGKDLSAIVNRDLTEEEINLVDCFNDKLVVYDHIQYGSDIKTICANMQYMTKAMGCKLVIFDNLSFAATHLSGDERMGIDRAMVELKDATVKNNFTLLNVTHLKRSDYLEDEAPNVEMIRGSQGVEMYSDYIIGLHRDKANENETLKNTLEVHVLADRMTGEDTGKHFCLTYNTKTRQLEG